MLLGTMPAETTLESVYEQIAVNNPDIEAMDVKIISSDRGCGLPGCFFCLRAEAAAVEEALRAGGFARPSQVTDKAPAKKKADLIAEIQKLNSEIGKN